MTLHIFNPDHDIALASGLSNFTAPHAGRQLRHDLGFLPSLWAAAGDRILVDDPVQAAAARQRTLHRLCKLTNTEDFHDTAVTFIPWNHPFSVDVPTAIAPWGWNSALVKALSRRGILGSLLPSTKDLENIRLLSHRRLAATLLPQLRLEGTVGESFACTTVQEVETLLLHYGQLVLKAPWSSSGRGLRFLSKAHTLQAQLTGWLHNIVRAQGCVMAEPYYNKVKDFGMEFHADSRGHVTYQGLSLFHTSNGTYTGNILATEKTKKEMISSYLSVDLLNSIQALICKKTEQMFKDVYTGPFGIDMMVVGGNPCLLHPCVELNLRRTMGHVALAISPTDDDTRLVMRIEYANNNYSLKINRL